LVSGRHGRLMKNPSLTGIPVRDSAEKYSLVEDFEFSNVNFRDVQNRAGMSSNN
jgi:hypothetical protein